MDESVLPTATSRHRYCLVLSASFTAMSEMTTSDPKQDSVDTKSGFDAKAFLALCSTRPGVYQMYDAQQKMLYVGKARNLKSRLSSYFVKHLSSLKTAALVARIASIETTITGSEVEALLLEQTLIKQHMPGYNILLRDDKTYPYIRLTLEQDFPKASLYRGRRNQQSRFFGPYPGAGSARDVLNIMEKAFQLRNCSESFFRNRTRPCLQYQIKRCTAPCVGYVDKAQYRQQVEQAIAFLDGQDDGLTHQLQQQMEQAAIDLDYETAAQLRDRLAAIQEVRQHQNVDTGNGNLDAVAVAMNHGEAIISFLMIRQGRVLGHRSITVKGQAGASEAAILTAFVEQHYLAGDSQAEKVTEILLDRELDDVTLLESALQATYNKKIRLAWRVRGRRLGFVKLAAENAQNSLRQRLALSDNIKKRFLALDQLLAAKKPLQRIECFDISHTSGQQAVASCVVALRDEGMARRQYRKFNIASVVDGDDYAALEEAVGRRLKRLTTAAAALPDLLLIDGGKGQVSRIRKLLDSLELQHAPLLLGISEGEGKHQGLNLLHFSSGREVMPAADNLGFILLQQIRDEAHRFAITSHRARRAKNISHSTLEDVAGVGPVRRRQLLRHFGGMRGLRNASLEAIAQVEGINDTIATQLYDHFHGS